MVAARTFLGRLLREPLVHFAVLAGVLFGLLSEPSAPDPVADVSRIVISGAEVERMALAWAQRWQRPPNEDELAGLVDEAIREQVLYREALALGLDRDDVVIRRHLRQKYEFVTQDLAYDTDPDEATLRAYHKARPDRYAQSAQVSFSQILFSTDRRGAAAGTDAARALADLQTATAPDAADLLGDATSLPSRFDRMSTAEVEAIFGPDFAAALVGQEPGRWAGPIPSGYGLHLVLVSEKISGGQLAFETVRQRVKDDWVYEQRAAANEAIFRKLLERYDVVVEPMATSTGASGDGS
ncbi:MAG: peptidyl-prolyl cis-trans isomerase [Rhodobacter sp.]|nr:peptidyl-prolyl cis-trans isomerase [Rhodobacter sp.]MCA3492886.1 peptidyl-prolyl cis-trans isomerase [Rhodobacter sp.]MCA3498742.1 peptidyl-prolyl cis-trans isomerase [Rhodobacter sp.]MCA3502420.1 peptidyl-prolyl cis-trans isomerase [Rhodobacter sp.]